MHVSPLLELALYLRQVVVQVFDPGRIKVPLIHDLVIRSELLVALLQGHANVLNVVNHTLAEVVVVLVVQLQISEQVCFADHVVTVHVKHLKGKLFELA